MLCTEKAGHRIDAELHSRDATVVFISGSGQLDAAGYQRVVVSVQFERLQSVILRSACVDANRIDFR